MRIRKIRSLSENDSLVEERRRQIIDRALPLFVKRGFQQTTVRDIAKACHMTHAAIYRYVGKKEDLVSLVINNMYAGMYAFIEEIKEKSNLLSPTEVLIRAIDIYYKLLDEHRDSSLFLTNSFPFFGPGPRSQIIETQETVTAVFEDILKKGGQGGEFRVDNAWLCAYDILGSGHLWSQRRQILIKRCSLEEYIQFHTDKVLCQIRVAR